MHIKTSTLFVQGDLIRRTILFRRKIENRLRHTSIILIPRVTAYMKRSLRNMFDCCPSDDTTTSSDEIAWYSLQSFWRGRKYIADCCLFETISSVRV